MSYDKFIDNIFIQNNQNNTHLLHNNNELLLFPDYPISNNINLYSIIDYDSNIQVDFQSNIQLYNELDISKYIVIKDNVNNPILYLVNQSLSKIIKINKNTKLITKTNINEIINYDINTSFFQTDILTSKSLIYNNKIYITPFLSQQITIYNIINNIIETTIDISNYTSNIHNNYSDSIIHNSIIYYIPYDANNIGLFNVNTNSFSIIESPHINPTRKAKYKKGVLYNDKIFCIPYNSGNIGIIDTTNNTFSIFNDFLFQLEDMYSTAIIADNKLYLIPHKSTDIYIYDPINNISINNISIKSSGINNNKHKFIDAVLDQDNSNIYLIPDKIPEFSVFNYSKNKFSILFKLNQDEPSFSRSHFDYINKNIYMIPGNSNYLGILKEPYNKINYFHTLQTTYSNLHCSDGIIHNSNIFLISKYNQNNVYTINLNTAIYNYHGFDNYNLNSNINSILHITDPRYIFRNYNSGILINNDIYMIENNGMHLSKINLITCNITDIQILPLDLSTREIIAYTDLENVDSKIYTILGKFNTVVEYDIDTKNIDYFNLNNYDVTEMKFIKGIYNNLINAIYMIPYNIIGIGILYLNSRTYQFKKIDTLNPLINRPFFNNAIYFSSHLYLIPSNENYIYIFNIINETFSRIDISNRNFNNNKYVDAFIINQFTYLFPNNSNKIAKLCYDITNNATLEGTADFKLISKDVYKKLSNNQYSLQNLIIGINTNFNAIYQYGIIIPTIITYYDDQLNKSFEWKYQKTNNYDSKEFIVTENTLTTDLNGDIIFQIFKGELQGNLVEFTLDKLLKNNKFDNSFINSIYDINTGNIFLFPYDLKHLFILDVNLSIPILKTRTIQSKNDLNSSLSKYINFEQNKIIASIIINENLYMITDSSTDNAGLNYIPFIIYNLNTNESQHLNIYDKTFGERINTFSSIVYSHKINTLFLIPNKHKTIVYYNIIENSLGEVLLFDSITNQNLDSEFLYQESLINQGSSLFSDAKIIDDYIYLIPSDGNIILKYKIRTYYEFIKETNSSITIYSQSNNIPKKFSKAIYHSNFIYLIPHNLTDIIIFNIQNNNITIIPILDGINGDNEYFKDAVIVNINNQPYIYLVPYNANKLITFDINSNQLLYFNEPIFNNNKFGSATIDHKGNIYFIINTGYIFYYKLNIIKQYIKPRLPVSFYDKTISFSRIYKKFHKAYVYNNYNFNNKIIRFSDYYKNGGFTYYVQNKITENKFISSIDNQPLLNSNIPEIYNNNLNYTNNSSLFLLEQSSNILNINKFFTAYSNKFSDFINQQNNINSITIQFNNNFLYYFNNLNNLFTINISTGTQISTKSFPIIPKKDIDFFNIDIKSNMDTFYNIINITNLIDSIRNPHIYKEIIFNLTRNQFISNILNIEISSLKKLPNINIITLNINGTLDNGLTNQNNYGNDYRFHYLIDKDSLNFEQTTTNLTWEQIDQHSKLIPNSDQLSYFIKKKYSEIHTDKNRLFVTAYKNEHSALGLGSAGTLEIFPLFKEINFNKNIIKIASGALHTIFLEDNGRVHGCGYSEYGQLGFGDSVNGKATKTSPQQINILNNSNITNISCGGNSSIFLTDTGEAYTCGVNSSGQLGLGHTTPEVYWPTLITNLEYGDGNGLHFYRAKNDFISCECGYNYSIFLTGNGKAYGCGLNNSGELGLGDTTEKLIPTLINFPNDPNIIKVACSYQFTIFLTKDGRVYSCGLNNFEQLALGDTTTRHTPELISNPNIDNIIDIGCNRYSTIFIKNNGKVYGCGKNDYGQLGLGDTNNRDTPTLVNYFDQNNIYITKVSCGYQSTVFLTDNGQAYGCGNNRYLNIGIIRNMPENINKPQLLRYNNDADIYFDDIFCNKETIKNRNRTFFIEKKNVYPENTFFHKKNTRNNYSKFAFFCGQIESEYMTIEYFNKELTSSNKSLYPTLLEFFYYNNIEIKKISILTSGYMVLTKDGRVYGCGLNDEGQLGLGHIDTKKTPELVDYFDGNNIKITNISCGYKFSIFLSEDGRVYGCGFGVNGQSGLGHNSMEHTPKLIPNLYNITNIDCNSRHSLFLTSDGRVYGSGLNAYGELGLGNNSTKYTPELIPSVDNITNIACGVDYSIFIKNNGRVYVCGSNEYGQLGLGDTNSRNTPVLVNFFNTKKITKVSCSKSTIFLDDNGQAYSCGLNNYGQLGLGDTNHRYTPELVNFFDTKKITKVSSNYHTIFLDDNGQAYSCGQNNYGQLALGDTNHRYTPVKINYFIENNIYIYDIAVINNNPVYFTIFLSYENKFETENKSLNKFIPIYNSNIPEPHRDWIKFNYNNTSNLLTSNLLSTEYYSNIEYDETYSQKLNQSNLEEYGNSLQSNSIYFKDYSLLNKDIQLQPIKTFDINLDKNSVLNINKFENKNLLLFKETTSNLTWDKANNEIYHKNLPDYKQVDQFIQQLNNNNFKFQQKNYGCGNNNVGQLGLGDTTERLTPTLIPNLDNITNISANNNHSMFLTSDGRVYSCGDNTNGQLGLGDIGDDFLVPTLIPNLYNITDIASGNNHSIFLTSDGRVYSCGQNNLGQSGLGVTFNDIVTPTLISNLDNITKVSCGYLFTIFLTSDGKVYGCGLNNNNHQLGFESTYNKYTPELIPNLDNITITNIASGGNHNLFLTSDGRVYSCGDNTNGQLGLGDTTTKYNTTLIPNLDNITNIASGGNHTLFLTSDGRVYSCGYNHKGQLGLGDTNNRNTPELISNLDNITITNIACGSDYSIFLTSDGIAYGCGDNSVGQLGLGDTNTRYTLTLINETKFEKIFTGSGSTHYNNTFFILTNDYKNKYIPVNNLNIPEPHKDWIKFNDDNTSNLLSIEYYSNVQYDETYSQKIYQSNLEEYGNSLQSNSDSIYFWYDSVDILEINNHMSWDDYKLHVELNLGRLPYRNEIIDLFNQISVTSSNSIKNTINSNINENLWIPVNDYVGSYLSLDNYDLRTTYYLITPQNNEIYDNDTTLYNSSDFIESDKYNFPKNYIFYVPNQNIIYNNINETEININLYINQYLEINITEEPSDINNVIINSLDAFKKTIELEININYEISKNTIIDLEQFINQFKFINKIYFNINKTILSTGIITFKEIKNIHINDIDILVNYNTYH